MYGLSIKSLMGLLGVSALVLSMSGVALAVPPPPEEVPPWLGIILDRLDDIEAKGGPCEVPPVWGKKFAGADRFVAVLDGAAYCDQETGLVWEGSPDPTAQDSWQIAINHCVGLEVDDRKGWALPMREQLATLVDTQSALCAGGGACLPDGHPFSDVPSAVYWSATTMARRTTFAWGVDFRDGFMSGNGKDSGTVHAWCVRGGQAFDGNTHDTLH